MPRIARVVAVDMPHHITQRGNYQNDVFSDDADREKYLSIVYEASKRADLIIIAYCLMSNHVHFIGIPREEDSLSRAFNSAQMRSSQYYN